MNAAHRSIQLDAVGGMLAVIGGTFVGVGAVQTAGSHQDVWSNPWFDGGCAVVALGFLLVISVIVPWVRSWRRRPPALLLLLGSEIWHPFYDVVWGVGLAVHIINRTSDPVTIVRCGLLSGSDVRQHPLLSEKAQQDVSNWIVRISSEHRSELFTDEFTVPPRGSVTLWFVSSAYAPRNGDRPHLTIHMKDTLNNTYELSVPAHRHHLPLCGNRDQAITFLLRRCCLLTGSDTPLVQKVRACPFPALGPCRPQDDSVT